MYFEEFIQMEPEIKGLGVRPVQEAGVRKLGVDGAQDATFTQPITLHRGHKLVTIRASLNRPLRVRTMLQKLEGKIR